MYVQLSYVRAFYTHSLSVYIYASWSRITDYNYFWFRLYSPIFGVWVVLKAFVFLSLLLSHYRWNTSVSEMNTLVCYTLSIVTCYLIVLICKHHSLMSPGRKSFVLSKSEFLKGNSTDLVLFRQVSKSTTSCVVSSVCGSRGSCTQSPNYLLWCHLLA